MVILRDHADGMDLSSWKGRIRFPMSAIDQNNVDKFQAVFGDQNWDKVDFSYFRLPPGAEQRGYLFDLKALFRSVSN